MYQRSNRVSRAFRAVAGYSTAAVLFLVAAPFALLVVLGNVLFGLLQLVISLPSYFCRLHHLHEDQSRHWHASERPWALDLGTKDISSGSVGGLIASLMAARRRIKESRKSDHDGNNDKDL